MQKPQKGDGLAHREGRTRSLQIVVVPRRRARHKSLTLYPIELGGLLTMTGIGVIRPCMTLRTRVLGAAHYHDHLLKGQTKHP
jgi:hypothetical protein